jgi:hypothetical protein
VVSEFDARTGAWRLFTILICNYFFQAGNPHVVSEFDARTGAWLRFHGLDPAYCGGVGRGGAGGVGGKGGGDTARYQQALQLQGIAGITVSSSVRTVFFFICLRWYRCVLVVRAVVIGTGIATCFLTQHSKSNTLNPKTPISGLGPYTRSRV